MSVQIREYIGVGVLTLLVSFGVSMLASGQKIGTIETKVENNTKELDKRADVVGEVPVIAEKIININEKVETGNSNIKEIQQDVGALQNEFHTYKVNTIKVHAEQSSQLQRILDRLER